MSEENPARLSFDYVWAQVNAAIGILTRNPNAVAAFDFSFAGFFRSFLAAIIVLPIYVYELIAGREFIDELRAADPALAGNLPGISFPYVLVEGVHYAAQWLVFPVLFVFLARMLRLTPRYVPFIVAYNWAVVPTMALSVVPLLLYGLGIAGIEATSFLNLIAIAAVLYYRWAVTMASLQCPPVTAAGIVIFDFLISVFITLGFGTLQQAL